MIRAVREVYEGKIPDNDDDLTYWSYLICWVYSGYRYRYDLIRINNLSNRIERLGCELTYRHCQRIIQQYEPSYPY